MTDAQFNSLLFLIFFSIVIQAVQLIYTVYRDKRKGPK